MRTTITLDDEVFARLERLRHERKLTLKDIVNEALRKGLDNFDTVEPTRRFQTGSASVGRLRVTNVDNVAGVLDDLEDGDLL
ncbi:ribbon-helix-helix domain-containing protein [Planotetraspora sp. A-T 1434]|uniref:ribbon-helix-helix domain-containing protein n=1 Tax=Planotetraspora sp. A-T 1434 TaxID=2979219 RepID=UPI0021C14A7E|nr:CopG family transcriptional regulator [Planotetraspora sp. A-T 1434]MCT9934761.1 ribbon-helix-helix domain-containing protein [Planotetraspora sp. A-T 1434]